MASHSKENTSQSNLTEDDSSIDNLQHTKITSTGRWTDEEHKLFIEGVLEYGHNWKKVELKVGSRTSMQSRSHGQKFLEKIKGKFSYEELATIKRVLSLEDKTMADEDEETMFILRHFCQVISTMVDRSFNFNMEKLIIGKYDKLMKMVLKNSSQKSQRDCNETESNEGQGDIKGSLSTNSKDTDNENYYDLENIGVHPYLDKVTRNLKKLNIDYNRKHSSVTTCKDKDSTIFIIEKDLGRHKNSMPLQHTFTYINSDDNQPMLHELQVDSCSNKNVNRYPADYHFQFDNYQIRNDIIKGNFNNMKPSELIKKRNSYSLGQINNLGLGTSSLLGNHRRRPSEKSSLSSQTPLPTCLTSNFFEIIEKDSSMLKPKEIPRIGKSNNSNNKSINNTSNMTYLFQKYSNIFSDIDCSSKKNILKVDPAPLNDLFDINLEENFLRAIDDYDISMHDNGINMYMNDNDNDNTIISEFIYSNSTDHYY